MARYKLIKGAFRIVGTQPDGDTIRFRPDDPKLVAGLGPKGQKPAFSANGTEINVRFEGIDALETHFSGHHQQTQFAALAAERMLALAGFTAVTRSGETVTSATPDMLRGHVLANELDSYGRMIAFIFAGDSTDPDGADAFLDAPTLATSVNAMLLAEGVVYPAFYTTLPVDLKDNLKAQSKLVRERAIGLWPLDAPSVERSADIASVAAASELVMWPKLFRRLVSYFQGGQTGLAGFEAWLREDKKNRDDFLQLPTGEIGNMHDLIAITGDTMRLRFRPEDLVVLPDTFVPQPVPAPPPVSPPPVSPPPVSPPPVTAPAPGSPAETVRIIAALVNPAGADTGHETVTLINRSAGAVPLDGWQLRDRQLQAAGRVGQPLSGPLGSGETLRVVLRAPVRLSNSGDDLVLVDAAGSVVQTATFTRREAAPPGVTILF